MERVSLLLMWIHPRAVPFDMSRLARETVAFSTKEKSGHWQLPILHIARIEMTASHVPSPQGFLSFAVKHKKK